MGQVQSSVHCRAGEIFCGECDHMEFELLCLILVGGGCPMDAYNSRVCVCVCACICVCDSICSADRFLDEC